MRLATALLMVLLVSSGRASANGDLGDQLAELERATEIPSTALGPEAGPSQSPSTVEGQDLFSRAVALAAPLMCAPGNDGAAPSRQTSPRYAAYRADDLDAAFVLAGWSIPEPSPSEAALLNRAIELVALTEGSRLRKSLVVPGLASAVGGRLSESQDRIIAAIFVRATRRGAHTDMSEAIDRAVGELAHNAPTEELRAAVRRYLRKDRLVVVELVPRNAPDPGADTLNPRAKKQGKDARNLRGAKVHSVKSGDTLTHIARRYRTTVAALVRANRLNPKKPIRPGQKLVISR